MKASAGILAGVVLVGAAALAAQSGAEAPRAARSVPTGVVPSTPVPVNEYQGMQEREEVYEFAEKPKVTKSGDKWVIAFASKGRCDATVSVVDKDGRIVRHVASGVLGKNAPWPFQQGALSQKVEWDGKDEFGKPAPAGCRVKVSLGLKFAFDKQFGWMCNRLNDAQGLAVDGEGQLYVLRQYEDIITLGAFDRDGKYLRTILPHPASVPPERMTLIEWSPTVWGDRKAIVRPGGGSRCYDRYSLQHSTDMFPSQQGPAVTPDGRLVLSFGRVTKDAKVKGCKLAIIDKRDGAAPPEEGFGFVDADTGSKGGPLGEGGVFMAASPDGQWLYTGGSLGTNGKGKTKPTHSVTRMSLKKPGNAEVFLGDQAASGKDDKHFNEPRGVACDKEGRLYVADRGNDRIQVFGADGKLVKSLPVDKPDQLAVHPKTGAIYVGCAPGKGMKLVKLGGLDDPAPKASLDLVRYGVMALDASRDPAALWVAAEGICRYEDKGAAFEKTAVLRDVNAPPNGPWGNWVASDRQAPYVVVDPLREELYVREHGGITDGSPLARVDGRTGKLIETIAGGPDQPLLAGVEQVLGTGPDGLVYMRTVHYSARKWLIRYDPDAKKWVPFTENATTIGEEEAKGLNKKYPVLVQAYPLGPYIAPGQPRRSMQDLWTVAPNGDIYIPGGPSQEQIAELKSGGQPYPHGEVKDSGTGPVRRGRGLQVFAAEGKRKTVSALPGLCGIDNPTCIQVRVGRGGAVYVAGMFHPVGQEVPEGIAPDGKYNRGMWGGIIRFASSYDKFPVGKMVGGWEEALEGEPTHYVGENTQIPVRVENAMWTYGGIVPLINNGCTCLGSSFDVDRFDRVFVPAAHTCSVNVLDTNGNLILRVGGYGNPDSRGGESAVVDPKTGVLRPRREGDPADLKSPLPGLAFLFPRYATVSDEALYVEDMENERVVRAALGYNAEEEAPLP